MKTTLYPSNSRGKADHGWLHTRFSFSFSEYYDPARIHFGMLRVINDDIIDGGGGFPMHPHENMEIITIPMKGALRHTDSMGNTGLIGENEIQVMSAGTGILHAEFNDSKSEIVSLFQIWIFPEQENIKPRYDQKKFDLALFDNSIFTVVSPDGTGDSLMINQQAWLSLGRFEKETTVNYQLKRKGNGVFLLVIEGYVTVNNIKLEHRDALEISETDEFEMKIGSDSQLLLIDVPMR